MSDRDTIKQLFAKGTPEISVFCDTIRKLQVKELKIPEIEIHIFYALLSLLGQLVTVTTKTVDGEHIIVNEYIADKIIDDYISLSSCSEEQLPQACNSIVKTCIQVVVSLIAMDK